MQKLICIFLFSLVYHMAKSQDTITLIDSTHFSKNAIYIDIAGSTCTPFSLHYSYIFKTMKSSYFDLDYGIGYFPYLYYSYTNYVFGTTASLNWNTRFYKKHHMQYGAGLTYSDGFFQYGFVNGEKESQKAMYGTLRLGYKYQKMTPGLFFQINATPIFRIDQLSSPK